MFVRHDLTADPPFSRIDLVSCRNVLIYFDVALQKHVVPLFHYALNEPGFLVLGRTEALSGFAELFTLVDQQHKIYARRPGPARMRTVPPRAAESLERRLPGARQIRPAAGTSSSAPSTTSSCPGTCPPRCS